MLSHLIDSATDSVSEIVEHEIAHRLLDDDMVKAFISELKARYGERAYKLIFNAYVLLQYYRKSP